MGLGPLSLLAVIDLGSNTVRLAVFQTVNQKPNLLFDKKTVLGLVSYVENGCLNEEGMAAVCRVLNEYRRILNGLQIESDHIRVFATASIRNVANRDEAVEVIRTETGFAVDVLAGEEEAKLGFIGVTLGTDVQDGVFADIGGGSSEIIIYAQHQMRSAKSMPLGALNVYANYVGGLFPSLEEYVQIQNIVRNQMEELALPQGQYENLYGIGGTVRAAVKVCEAIYGAIEHNKLPVSLIENMLRRFRDCSKETIAPIVQHAPERIHTIVPGMMILHSIAKRFSCSHIIVSPYGIREGYVHAKMLKDADHECWD